jgi:arylsulfatase A-like enzyme
MADDLGYGDVGVYGQTKIKTPNIDSLAKQGLMFTQFYAGSTVCAPSRSALLTGLHTGHTRIRGNAQNTTLFAEDTTVAEIMKQAGYVTGIVGKWGLGEQGSPGIPNRKGFDYFYGYLSQVHAHNHYPSFVWENENPDSLRNVVETVSDTYAKGVGGIAVERKDFIQDKFLEKTISFLEQNKDTSFFLYLPFILPHANNEARRWDKSGMEVPDFGIYKNESWPESQKGHAAMITYLDKDVGLIIQKLKELGLDDNTLVIFTSDNGPHDEGGADHTFFDSNGPLRGLKRDLYEGGIRVPTIAWWPGVVAPNTKSDKVFAFWDVLPTLAELIGTNPTTTDGISFLSTLKGDSNQPHHEYLYWEFYENGGRQAVLIDNWKYIKLNVNKPGESEALLFDLSVDLGEQNNVTTQNPDIVERAEKILKSAHTYSQTFNYSFE